MSPCVSDGSVGVVVGALGVRNRDLSLNLNYSGGSGTSIVHLQGTVSAGNSRIEGTYSSGCAGDTGTIVLTRTANLSSSVSRHFLWIEESRGDVVLTGTETITVGR